MKTESVLETRRQRRRRVTAKQRRSVSLLHSRAVAAQRPHLRVGWYAGLAVMAAVEVIEWPLAILMMLGHELAHRAHTEALRDFAEGVEAGM